MQFEPLKITAWLQCAVLSDKSLPLDGILLFYAMREKYGGQAVTVPGQVGAVEMVRLPLARVNPATSLWFYAVSWAQWDIPLVEGISHWHKRGDWDRLGDMIDWGKKRRVETRKGRYKAYRTPVLYRHALSVTWYVRGDAAAIAALLRHATHIGKKTAQGWGAVWRWAVEPSAVDYSIYDADRQPNRAIPTGAGLLAGFRPPYWARENQARCMLPVVGQ